MDMEEKRKVHHLRGSKHVFLLPQKPKAKIRQYSGTTKVCPRATALAMGKIPAWGALHRGSVAPKFDLSCSKKFRSTPLKNQLTT